MWPYQEISNCQNKKVKQLLLRVITLRSIWANWEYAIQLFKFGRFYLNDGFTNKKKNEPIQILKSHFEQSRSKGQLVLHKIYIFLVLLLIISFIFSIIELHKHLNLKAYHKRSCFSSLIHCFLLLFPIIGTQRR